MTRALLLLMGGRSLPDMLFVKYMVKNWVPDRIFAITTRRGWDDAEQFKAFSHTHFGCDIEVLDIVDPFDEEQVKARCNEALALSPDTEWVAHFTGSPKAVGIYAYEVMKEHGFPFYFLDTDGQRAISLPSKNTITIYPEELYRATVQEYMGAYGRTGIEHKDNSYHIQAQEWYSIAELFVEDYDATMALLEGVRKTKERHHLTPTVSFKAQQLVQKLQDVGFLTIERQTAEYSECNLLDDQRYKFVAGGWLEVYVWCQLCQENFADDCEWGHIIKRDQTLRRIHVSNELDIAVTYNAKLLIGECKTSAKPFDSIYLDKLNSIAHLIGMGYVRQVFITNHPRPPEKNKSFSNFCRQAKVRNILVITGEQLPHIGKLLKQEIMDLDRNR